MKRLLLLLVVCLAACTEREATETSVEVAGSAPVVIASNYPLYFFAHEIAGGAVDVRFPEIEGDPAFWSPSADQAAMLQSADLLILNGAGYEAWLSFVTVREERLVDTTQGLQDQLLPLEEATVHQHGPEGEHTHGGTAFTTWLNPQLAIEQARAISMALAELAPEHEDDFDTRLASLESRLNSLDRSLREAFDGFRDAPVIFSHPVYQYLQDRYGINGRSVHWEPEEAPGVKAWVDFQNLLIEHPAGLLIWEGEPLAETTEKLGESGLESLVFSPVSNRPVQGDYFDVMASNLAILRAQIAPN